MKERSWLRKSGIVLTALLALITFAGNALAQCSPNGRSNRVVQRQQRYNNYNNQVNYYGPQNYPPPPPQYRNYGYNDGYNNGYYGEYDRGPSKTKNIGVGAAVGAVGGALLGGTKGALIGAGAGAGVGYIIYKNKKRKQEEQYYNPYRY